MGGTRELLDEPATCVQRLKLVVREVGHKIGRSVGKAFGDVRAPRKPVVVMNDHRSVFAQVDVQLDHQTAEGDRLLKRRQRVLGCEGACAAVSDGQNRFWWRCSKA